VAFAALRSQMAIADVIRSWTVQTITMLSLIQAAKKA
jgi:hypothetical protein